MLTAGTVLNGRYTVETVLGQGGMGAVYLAFDKTLGGKKVAIKEMAVQIHRPDDRDRALAQFREEARLLASLEHPRLVPVTDFFEEGENAYLVMGYVDGRTLAEASVERDVPLSEVVGWIDQIADVLEYLHEHEPPVLFRDLKPGNVMLDRRGQVRLIDFGIARALEAGQSTSTFLKGAGTAEFAPPEQFGGRGTDPRSDIYALGATMYDLTTSELPPVSVNVMTGETPPPNPRRVNPAIPPPLDAIIVKAMALRKEDRYASAREVRLALSRISAELLRGSSRPGGAVQAAPVSPETPPVPGHEGDDPVGARATDHLPPAGGPTIRGVPPLADRSHTVRVDADLAAGAVIGDASASPRPWRGMAVVGLIAALLVGARLWLRPASANHLRITSTPPGARVSIDGTVEGEAPLTLNRGEVTVGEHTIALTKNGYQTETFRFVARDGRFEPDKAFRGRSSTAQERQGPVTTLDVALRQTTGTLVLKVTPEVFALRVDGQRVDAANNASVTLPPGHHSVTVSAKGRRSLETTVEIAPDQAVPLVVTLPTVTGTLVVESPTRGATVKIDGDAGAPAPRAASLGPGRHHVTVERAGFISQSTDVTLSEGQTETLIASLVPRPTPKPPPAPPATRTITDVPPPVLVRETAPGPTAAPEQRPSRPLAGSDLPEPDGRPGRFPKPPRQRLDGEPAHARTASLLTMRIALDASRNGQHDDVMSKYRRELQQRQISAPEQRLSQIDAILRDAESMRPRLYLAKRDALARELLHLCTP